MWITPRDHKIIGESLETIRKSAGMTQQELASRLKKPQSFVSSYESGQRRIDLLEMIRIIGAVGADPRKVITHILDRLIPKPRAR